MQSNLTVVKKNGAGGRMIIDNLIACTNLKMREGKFMRQAHSNFKSESKQKEIQESIAGAK